MISVNQVMGVILICLGTFILGLTTLLSRKYTKTLHPSFWKKQAVLGKKGKYEFYGITPEQIFYVFGTILLIIGTILSLL